MTWWLALPALAGFQALVLPREHPPGGLDNQELRVADSRVCLWYSTELGPLYRSGRTVFVQKGYERRRLGNCSDSYYGPVQSISLHRGEIVRRWPGRVVLSSLDGRGTIYGNNATVDHFSFRWHALTAPFFHEQRSYLGALAEASSASDQE